MTGGGGDTDVEPTAEEKALAEIATQRLERYKESFVPAEDEFIASVQSIGEGDAELAAGTATAGTQQAFSQAQGEIAQSQTQSGAAPGSGRFNESVSAAGDDAAASRGQAVSAARRGTTDRRLSGLEAVTSIGQGQDAEALGTLSDVAREANRESIQDAQISANNRATNAQAFGTAVGLGGSFLSDGSTFGKTGSSTRNTTQQPAGNATPFGASSGGLPQSRRRR